MRCDPVDGLFVAIAFGQVFDHIHFYSRSGAAFSGLNQARFLPTARHRPAEAIS
jgi:hypothetical protein